MEELQIKITFGETDIFLQGNGELVYKLFNDIRENGIGKLERMGANVVRSDSSSKEDNINRKNVDKDKKEISNIEKNVKSKTKKVSGNSYQLLKDLDLSGNTGSIKSLAEFINEKQPNSNLEKTVLFVYYLENMMGIKELTIDHIFTCYKTMNYRIPQNLPQNIADASSSRYGHINRQNGNYSMTIRGINYVEHDMPKKKEG